jgi:hypothetical protein
VYDCKALFSVSRMAKRRPVVTLLEMQKELGFQVEIPNDETRKDERFYSDLSPVSNNILDRTEKELQEHRRQKCQKSHNALEFLLPGLGEIHVRPSPLLTPSSILLTFCLT